MIISIITKKLKVWRKIDQGQDENHTSSFVKSGVGTAVSYLGLAWLILKQAQLIFIDDGSHECSRSQTSTETLCHPTYRYVYNLIGRNVIMQKENDSKHVTIT